MASDQLMVAALNHPFALGMLYDARRHKLNTDFTLWDRETIEKNSTRQPQTGSTYEISASDSIESKSSLLKIDNHSKTSWLCGLIESSGSSIFLNDNKQFKNQSRVTLQFTATTAYERLTMTHLEAKNTQIQDVIKKCRATHVVTGILYGANAIFVFDSERLGTNIQKMEESMKAAVKRIMIYCSKTTEHEPLPRSDEEKDVTDKFSCTFYGDFILDSNPTTFEDAVKTCSQLPKLIRENGENSVPVKVWLTPLKNLDPTAAELKGEICVGLLRKAENALQNLKEMEMRCNDSLDEELVQSFPQIHKELSRFQNLCEDNAKKLRQTMKDTFPSILEGKKDDNSLEQLLDDQKTSPFSMENLDKWLDNTEREINVIRSCVEKMEGIKIAKDEAEWDRGVLIPGVEDALCFVFTSLETDDPYLDQMYNYLRCHDSHYSFSPPTKEKWFFSEKVLADMRQKAGDFCSIAKGLKSSSKFSFIVASERNKKYQGATIYHYRNGSLTTQDFSKPAVPSVASVKDRRDLFWYTCDLTLDPNTANSYLILSEENKKAACGAWQNYPDLPERFDTRPQVLCMEGLTGRHYWEVEWSNGYNNNVGVAVTYRSIGRKGKSDETGLGNNHKSWYFSLYEKELSAWHNGKVWSGTLPSAGCSRVGVFLDWPAGTLSFYQVSHNALTHFYTFHATFTEPVHPVCYSGNKGVLKFMLMLQT
uniref:B30.2/SPRY domain-containing protein n=1 Tax=Amphilophus citrinellus TaxID=61819 RepID=A0A3Q0SBR3_AMPCI